MTEVQPPPVRRLEQVMAPVMFGLSFLYLLVAAGLIHRSTVPSVTEPELRAMYAVLAVLSPLFAVESLVAFFRRLPTVSRFKAFVRVFLVMLFPPFRLGWIHPATDRLWLPIMGWQQPGKPLAKHLEKRFGGPMLVFAFLILPVLGLEYVQAERVKADPRLELILNISVSLIWVAFAAEFVIKVSASRSTLGYLKERWLDLAIVGLPMLEFILTRWVDAAPLLRLLRLGRAIGPQQLGAMNKMYRLRGLMMKGWHAFLLLEGMARITGQSPEKRLRNVEFQISELEEQLDDLRKMAETLKARIEAKGERCS